MLDKFHFFFYNFISTAFKISNILKKQNKSIDLSIYKYFKLDNVGIKFDERSMIEVNHIEKRWN